MAKTKNLLFVLLAALFMTALSANGLKAQAPDGGDNIPPQEVVKSDVQKVQSEFTANNAELKIQNSEFITHNSLSSYEASEKNSYVTENRKLIKSYRVKIEKFPNIKNDSKQGNISGRVKTSKFKATCRSGT